MVKAVQLPEPPLHTNEFELRAFVTEDVEAIMAAGGDPQITDHTFMPRDPDKAQARAWIQRAGASWDRGACRLAISAADDPARRCVGQAGVLLQEVPGNAEAVYWLLEEARGRRWGAQALDLLTRWAFEDLGIERMEVLIDIGNEASKRTAESAGFTCEGIRRGYERVPGRGRVDLQCFSRLVTD